MAKARAYAATETAASDSPERGWGGGGAVVFAPVITALIAVALWEVLVRLLNVPAYLLPSPSAIVLRLFAEFGYLTLQTSYTLQPILLGFGVSVLIGVPLAIAIVQWRLFEISVYPLLITSQVVPKIAIAPLFVVWFGFGLMPKILVVFLIAFFPVVIDSVIGLRSLEVEKIYLARSMGASPLKTFLKIRLPNALPSIFGGLKLAITFSVIGAIIAEFIGADRGIGRVLLIANGNLDTELLFAGVAMLTVAGILLFLAIDVLERLMIPWHVSRRVEHLAEGSL